MPYIRIEKIDSLLKISINENTIDHVADYKIVSSANGTTELDLKLIFKSNITQFEMSAIPIKPTS